MVRSACRATPLSLHSTSLSLSFAPVMQEEAHGDGPEGHMGGTVPESLPRPQPRSSGPIHSGQGGEGSEEEGEIKSTTPLGNQDLRKDLGKVSSSLISVIAISVSVPCAHKH